MKKILFISLAVVLALSVGLIGCEGEPTVDQYDLTVTSGLGGDVTTPTEGTHTYDEGATVNLVATPFTEYDFVEWTGDVAGIADVNAATTTMTMPSADAEITATFEWGGDPWTDAIDLDFHSTAPPFASLNEEVYDWWVANITADSGPDGGTFTFSRTFGDSPYTPEDSLTAISTKVVDVGQLSTDTFKLGEIGYLPFTFTMESAAYVTSIIYEEDWDVLGELDDVKMLLGSPLQPAQWWGNVNVTQLSDLSGLDVRAEGAEVPIVEGLGANAIEIGTGELSEALELGTVEGCFFTYSGGAFAFGLCDVTDYVSEVNLVLPRYMLAMNREVYEGLHPDARDLLDTYCTPEWSVTLAGIHEAAQGGAKGMIQGPGCGSKTIEDITDIEDWETACASVITDIKDGWDADGFDGQGILDRIDALIADYEAL